MHEINYCVYKHTSPSNKVYIGITSLEPRKRWLNGKGYIKNKYFYRAIEKYGWENIKHEILFNGLTKEEACQKEIELINLFKSNQKEYGYNLSSGGESGHAGCVCSEETRNRISKSSKSSLESTKRKISGTLTGRKLSEEHRRNIGIASKNRSEETKRKLSENNARYWKDREKSVEHTQKISDTVKRQMLEKSQAYKEYKENGGTLKWNDFQKLYNQPK